jgi:hypothetical protein
MSCPVARPVASARAGADPCGYGLDRTQRPANVSAGVRALPTWRWSWVVASVACGRPPVVIGIARARVAGEELRRPIACPLVTLPHTLFPSYIPSLRPTNDLPHLPPIAGSAGEGVVQ